MVRADATPSPDRSSRLLPDGSTLERIEGGTTEGPGLFGRLWGGSANRSDPPTLLEGALVRASAF